MGVQDDDSSGVEKALASTGAVREVVLDRVDRVLMTELGGERRDAIEILKLEAERMAALAERQRWSPDPTPPELFSDLTTAPSPKTPSAAKAGKIQGDYALRTGRRQHGGRR